MGCTAVRGANQTTRYDRLDAQDICSNELIRTTRSRNLEGYCLFWLDDTARSPELIEVSSTLRSIIDRVNIFDSTTECEKEFERIENEKIFLIANHIQGRLLLPKIHNHQQLVAIYLYQNDGSIDGDSIKNNYTKIKGLFDSFSEAKRYLEDDVRLQVNLDNVIVIDLPDDDDDDDDDEKQYREKFALFLATVNDNTDNVNDSSAGRTHLIDMCSEYYHGNIEETDFIKEFSRSYKPDMAISWYLRQSCFSRLVSRAFIVRDMNLLVDMYPFIVDLNRNIQKGQSLSQSSSLLQVFRAQFMSIERIALFKKNIGGIITMQCFLCAQSSREQALNLLHDVKTNDSTLIPILFEINVAEKSALINITPSNTSQNILFMLGSTFKITDVTETSILLSQCYSDSNDYYDLANEPPSIIKGIHVYLKNGYDPAINYFEKILLHLDPSDLTTRASVYSQLGYLRQKQGKLDMATEMYAKSMDNDAMHLGRFLHNLDRAAHYHALVLGDWTKAKTLWLQQLSIQQAFQLQETIAQTYEKLARGAIAAKQHADTVEYTLAAIKCLPNDHPRLPFLHEQLECAKKLHE